MRILVCGGRDYRDKAAVYRALDRVHAKHGITAIIQGAADGADRWGAEWGWDHGVPVASFPADWKGPLRSRAGPVRNQQMIDEGKPDAAVAFPGRRGTADMVRRLRTAGVPVWEPVAIAQAGEEP